MQGRELMAAYRAITRSSCRAHRGGRGEPTEKKREHIRPTFKVADVPTLQTSSRSSVPTQVGRRRCRALAGRLLHGRHDPLIARPHGTHKSHGNPPVTPSKSLAAHRARVLVCPTARAE